MSSWEQESIRWLTFKVPGEFIIEFASGQECRCIKPRDVGENSTIWFRPAIELIKDCAVSHPGVGQPIRQLLKEIGNQNLKMHCFLRAFSSSMNQPSRYFRVMSWPTSLVGKDSKEVKKAIATKLRKVFVVDKKKGRESIFLNLKPPTQALPHGVGGTAVEVLPAPETSKYSAADHARAREEYFRRGDTTAMRKARRVLYYRRDGKKPPRGHPGVEEAASKVCAFLSEWGQAVDDGYLLLEVFNSSPGDMVANMLCCSAPEIRDCRQSMSQRFAMWHALLAEKILNAGYLSSWSPQRLAILHALILEFRTPYENHDAGAAKSTKKGRKKRRRK